MSLQSYKEGQWLDAVMKTLSGTSLSRAERHNLDDEQLATLKAMKTALNGRTIPCRITGGIQDDGGFSKVMDYSRGHYDRSLVRNLESGFADKKDLGDFIRLNYVEAERLFAANLLTDEQSEAINIAIMDAAKNFENTAISKTALNSDALKYIAESAVQSIIPKDTVTLLHDLKYKISPDEMLASKDAIFASRTTSGKKFMLGEALTKSITSHMQSVQNGSMTAQNLCTLAYEAIQNTTKEFASLSSSARKSDIGLATLIEDAFTDAMARASGSEEEKQAFMDAMHSPEMNGFAHTMASLSNAQTGLANTHDFAALGMMNTALTTMRNVEGQEAPAVQSGQGATQSQAVPSPVHPHLITVENRAILATIMPAIAEKVDKAYPFFPLFPTAHNPDALPKNLAGRKAFLASMLPIYHAHERPASAPDGESDGVQEGYDRGTGYHGRGHICRAFVGAEVMANIMEKRGHTVDRAALAMGIAGHDSGRTNNGTDVEEHKSAAKTIESANAFVGAANLGADYTNEIGRCIDAHKSKTLEGHLLNAADSLDISRVKDFNFHYLSFLRGGTADGVTVEVPEDQALRVQLQKEVLQLAILTDPLVAMRPEIHEANMKFVMHSDNMAYLAAYREMVDAAQKMVCAVQDLEDLDIIARTDAAIQRYPHLFPLMTEHYLHQESV